MRLHFSIRIHRYYEVGPVYQMVFFHRVNVVSPDVESIKVECETLHI